MVIVTSTGLIVEGNASEVIPLLQSRGSSSCSFCFEAPSSLFLGFFATNCSSICPFSFEALFSVFLRFVATNCRNICPLSFVALFSVFFRFVASLKSDSIVQTCYELIDSTSDIYWASIYSILYKQWIIANFGFPYK